jgi:large subunit ribosomal protein L20
MNGLKLAGVEINRKMLADMAVNDSTGFAEIVNIAKQSIGA